MHLGDWAQWERVIILSPHLDDAVFSCGGLLSSERFRQPPLIITVFSGDSLFSVDERHGIALPESRRAEDSKVLAGFPVHFIHLGHQDAIDRTLENGSRVYPELGQVFGSPHLSDQKLEDALLGTLTPMMMNCGNVLLLAPLGVGGHVDHAVVARAAATLCRRGGNVMFYEDFPYVVAGGKYVGRPDSVGDAASRLGLSRISSIAVTFDPTAKVKGMLAYETQIELVFGNAEELKRQVAEHVHLGLPVENYWRLGSL